MWSCPSLGEQREAEQGHRPCKCTEVRARFSRDHTANLTPTFFCQCVQLHSTMPYMHPLLTSPITKPTISPTHIRLLVAELQPVTWRLQRQESPLPLSLGHLGLWHRFEVTSRHEEAIDFVDSNSGYLVAAHILGLLAVQKRAPTTIWAEGMHGHLIQFRCHAYNAVELEHVYHGTNRAHNPGIKGPVKRPGGSGLGRHPALSSTQPVRWMFAPAGRCVTLSLLTARALPPPW